MVCRSCLQITCYGEPLTVLPSGAWDTGSFDNDEAADWLGELEDADDAEPITEALLAVTENEEQVEAPEAQQALASLQKSSRR